MPSRHHARCFAATALLVAIPIASELANARSETTSQGCLDTAIVSSGADSGEGSLRDAVFAMCPGGRVEFSERLVIQLNSEITVGRPLIIDGSSVSGGSADALVQIRGDGNHRLLRVLQDGDLSLIRLRLSNGVATDVGGGIRNAGRLSVLETRFDGHSANSGNLGGGAIFNDNEASLSIERSSFDGNSAIRGSALFNAGEAEILNSTFSGNRGVTNEGAIQNRGALVANHITVTGNGREDAAPTAGGLFTFNADTTLINSILAGNTGRDCFISGGVVDTVAVLAQSRFNCPSILTADPQLEALSDNGAPTLSHAPGADSPALGAGDAAFCLPLDQRAFTRPDADRCDLGAIERDGRALVFQDGFETPVSVPAQP